MYLGRIVTGLTLVGMLCLFPGCGERKYANLSPAARTVAEYCDSLGGKVDLEEGEIVAVELNGDRVDDQAVTKLENAKSLKKLYLISAQITDAALARLNAFPKLEFLDVSGSSQITDAGLKHLKQVGTLRNFIFRGCQNVTEPGKDDLRKHFHDTYGVKQLLITGP
jgi:predicted DNA-binding antitoxin AbrB/MazE fold protein